MHNLNPQQTTHAKQNIAIAGFGLLGRLLAWQLLERGHRVSVFEAGPLESPKAAAHTAAGMVSPLSEAVDCGALIYQLGIHGQKLWRQWLTSDTESNQPTLPSAQPLYHETGSLVLAHPQDRAELDFFQRQLSRTLPGECLIEEISGADIQHLEPSLASGFQRALLLPSEAHIDNRELLTHLLERVRALGGTLYEHTPVTTDAHRVDTPDTHFANFDWVVDCRGYGAKAANNQLRGVRGEVLRVHSKEIQLQRPVRLMHPRYQLYVVPKPNHEFVIGATSIESEDLSAISLQSSMELSSALYTLMPAMSEARIQSLEVNLRPALMNNLPEVSESPGKLTANGLYRHGYLIAPSVIEHLLDRIEATQTSPFAQELHSNGNV